MLAIKGSGGQLFWPGWENPLYAWAIHNLDDPPLSFEYMQYCSTVMPDAFKTPDNYTFTF